MTTVAWRDRKLAADSYVTDDTTAIEVRKIVQLPLGQLAGGAGNLNEVAAGLMWLQGGCEGDPPQIPNSTFLFTQGGVCYVADQGWPGLEVKNYAAIGSGAQGAMVAMRLGMSAEDAVKAVAGIDPHTGGEIEALSVQKPRKRR